MSPPTEDEPLGSCLWQDQFPVASMLADPIRWDSDWTKVLRKLSAKDVYDKLSIFEKRQIPALKDVSDRMHGIQKAMMVPWDEDFEQGEFQNLRMLWLLLEDKERQKHLLHGLIEASRRCTILQNARALCPEITISSMTKTNGRAFIDFMVAYHENLKASSPDAPFLSHSEWWSKALPDTENTSLGERAKFMYDIFTIQREGFIAQFIQATMWSILNDMAYGSAGMDKARNMASDDPLMATMVTKSISELRTTPLLRCENCTKGQEELKNRPFMICSACKSKMNFLIHYCSPACQKQDWRRHKKQCGKEKVSKKLRGTIHDPYWAVPDFGDTMKDVPDYIRNSLPPGGDSEDAALESMGFGKPHPSLTITPALQRQIDLYTNAKEVDYFVFDELNCPFPFIVDDTWTKITFRNLRAQAISSPDRQGIEPIAEYVIKCMGQREGFSRDLIVGQFEREYGDDLGEKLQNFQSLSIRNGYAEGTTFIEVTSRSLDVTMSKIRDKRAK
ncbi:hypothetical protein FIBSPDRAFT_745471 [Athelia psychrophila]|uniref:MYND-type domain-containing protein n=1 Tax=Athelia psychrophila TaxID=1759441 RepID=A0A166H0L9_9AGAM|nr:hypothetical protein FIBSPDRAFT_745471 [Fibularhizoctonia sp. CBS 109695]